MALENYISAPNVQAAKQTSHADGDAWAAAARAQGAAGDSIGRAITGAAESLGAVMQAKENQEDKFYLANAKAAITLSGHEALQKARANVQPGQDVMSSLSSHLQQTALPFIQGAPSKATREKLQLALIPYSSGVMQKAWDIQTNSNNQFSMMQAHDEARRIGSLAAQDPSSLEWGLQSLAARKEQLTASGVPAMQVAQWYDQQQRALKDTSYEAMAKKDPNGVLRAANEGHFNYLGPKEVNQLRNKSEGELKTLSTLAETQVKNVREKLMSGQPVSNEIVSMQESLKGLFTPVQGEDVSVTAKRIKLQTELQEVERLSTEQAAIKNLTLPQMNDYRTQLLDKLRSDPNTPAGLIPKMDHMIEAQIKSAREDPISYVARLEGREPPMLNIPNGDITNNRDAQSQMMQMARMAAEAQHRLGLGEPVAPISKGNLMDLQEKMKSLPAENQLELIQGLKFFGSEGRSAIAKKLSKDAPEMSVAIELSGGKRKLATEILHGAQMLRTDIQGTKLGKAPQQVQVLEASNNVFGDLFKNNPAEAKKYIDAASAVYAYRSGAGSKDAPSQDYTEILKEVSGAVTMGGFFSGYQTIVPEPGMSKQDFQSLIDKAVPQLAGDISYADGNKVDWNNVSPDNFQYLPLNSGKYEIRYRGFPMIGPDGNRAVVDFSKLMTNE